MFKFIAGVLKRNLFDAGYMCHLARFSCRCYVLASSHVQYCTNNIEYVLIFNSHYSCPCELVACGLLTYYLVPTYLNF